MKKRIIIALAIVLLASPVWAGGYFVPHVTTKTEALTYKTVEKETVEEEVESRTVTWEEVSLKDKLASKDVDEKAFILDNICTWISATGTDPEGKSVTYHRRVTLREWVRLGKPKRVGGFSPYRVLLGHEPVMPDDKAINAYLETQDVEPVKEDVLIAK